MKNNFFIILSIAVALICTSCQQSDKAESEDTVMKSYRLIDEQRDDEAITLLEAELKKDPDNYDYKSVLASAYAHKAGFKIQKLVPLISIAGKLSKINLKSVDVKATESSNSDFSENVSKLQYALGAFHAIPSVAKDNIVYLEYAIYLLNSLDTRITAEDVVYRALLKILNIKFKMISAADININADATRNSLCNVNLDGLSDYIQNISNDFISIISDVKIANPDKKESLDSLSEQLNKSITAFKTVANSTDKLDDVTSALLKQTLFQSNLGAFIKCH